MTIADLETTFDRTLLDFEPYRVRKSGPDEDAVSTLDGLYGRAFQIRDQGDDAFAKKCQTLMDAIDKRRADFRPAGTITASPLK